MLTLSKLKNISIQLAITTALIFNGLALASPIKIEIITDATYFPYSFVDKQGQLKGIYLDIVNAGAKQLNNFDIRFTPLTWQEALKAMRNGDSPFILGAYYHGYDWDFLYPYSQPLLSENVVVICASGKMSKGASWPQDFKGKLVTHIAGYDGWLNNQVRARENTRLMNLLEVPNVMTAWEMLNHQRSDCSLFEKQVFAYATQTFTNTASGNQPLSENTPENNPPENNPPKNNPPEDNPPEDNKARPELITHVSTETVHIAMSTAWRSQASSKEKANAQLFLRQFDDALYQLRRSGEINNIVTQFINGQ